MSNDEDTGIFNINFENQEQKKTIKIQFANSIYNLVKSFNLH